MKLPLVPIHQGQTNGCGTAALAMALNCLYEQQGNPARLDQQALDAGSRVFDSFSAPGLLLALARRLGFRAAWIAQPDAAELRRQLAAGHPMLLFYSVDGTVAGLHYRVIYGDEELSDGSAGWLTCDPAARRESCQVLPQAWLDARYAQPITLKGWDTGLRAGVMVFSAADDLPAGAPMHGWLHGGYLINRLLMVIDRLLPSGFKETAAPPK